jgi:hypothetical protein
MDGYHAITIRVAKFGGEEYERMILFFFGIVE